MPDLSVCIIAKNAEKYIKQCLESVKDIAAEIIVADTGSTDRTIDIVRSIQAGLSDKKTDFQVPSPECRGDLEVRLYEIPWEDDFARARNESLKYATGRWVLVMDSDQELTKASIPELKKLLEDENKLGYYINIVIPKGHSVRLLRLFRNNYGIKYQGVIHEQVFQSVNKVLKKFPAFSIGMSDIKLIEYGYEETEEKSVRNIRLLKKALLNPSTDRVTRSYYLTKLGTKLLKTSPDDGLELLKEALQLTGISAADSKNYPHLQELYEIISLFYLKAKDFSQSNYYIFQGLSVFPESARLNFFLAGLHEVSGKNSEAMAYYYKTLSLLNKDGLTAINKKELKEKCFEGIQRCKSL